MSYSGMIGKILAKTSTPSSTSPKAQSVISQSAHRGVNSVQEKVNAFLKVSAGTMMMKRSSHMPTLTSKVSQNIAVMLRRTRRNSSSEAGMKKPASRNTAVSQL